LTSLNSTMTSRCWLW